MSSRWYFMTGRCHGYSIGSDRGHWADRERLVDSLELDEFRRVYPRFPRFRQRAQRSRCGFAD